MLKNVLRKKIKLKRDKLNPNDKIRREQKIFRNLFNLCEIKEARSVFIYLNFKSEVNTASIIDELIKQGKQVYVPKINGEEIVAVKYSKEMSPNSYGILEPISNILPGDIDVSIVPLLAVDVKGNRLGYGKGYYDKYFAKHNESFKIGLCFDFQIVRKVEHIDTDIPLNCIVSENKIFKD